MELQQHHHNIIMSCITHINS